MCHVRSPVALEVRVRFLPAPLAGGREGEMEEEKEREREREREREGERE
jgi:hypothetical protein